MKTVKQLREERASLLHQMEDLTKRAVKEGRDLTADEEQQWDAMDADFNKLTEKIQRTEAIEHRLAEESEPREERETKKPGNTKAEAEQKYNETFWQYAKYGGSILSPEQRNFLAKGQSEIRGTNPQITVTPAQGGYLIPQGFSNELEQRMKFYGGMLEAARSYRTATGDPIKWPTVDDTSAVGALLDESSPSIAVNDMTFGQKSLDAYTYTTGIVKVSVQLLQDSYFDLESFLREAFAERLGRIINQHLTTGSGTSQPNGVVTALAAIAAKGGIRDAAGDDVITRSDLINLMHDVDRAYRPNGAFMMNDTTLAAIKKLAIGSGDDRPLWQPSMREGEPDRIEGRPYFINNDLANIGAGNYPVVFGDFTKYIYRIAGDMVFVRMDERYMDSLQVGFIGYMRVDGEVIQNNAFKLLRNITT